MRALLTSTALAKAKAAGVVAAALTAGGAGGMIALSQVGNPAPPAHVVVSADATGSAEPTGGTPTPTATASASAAAAPTTSASALPSCPADVTNHGGYVSSVATSAPKGAGGHHGSWVGQAAHSDCGKPAGTPTGHRSSAPRHTVTPWPERTKQATTQHDNKTLPDSSGSQESSGSADSGTSHGHGGH